MDCLCGSSKYQKARERGPNVITFHHHSIEPPSMKTVQLVETTRGPRPRQIVDCLSRVELAAPSNEAIRRRATSSQPWEALFSPNARGFCWCSTRPRPVGTNWDASCWRPGALARDDVFLHGLELRGGHPVILAVIVVSGGERLRSCCGLDDSVWGRASRARRRWTLYRVQGAGRCRRGAEPRDGAVSPAFRG